MRAHTAQVQRRLVFIELLTLAVALPAIAGAVNAAGFMVVGAYLSHVTGNLARIGDEVALGNYSSALGFAIVIAAFLAGALLATLQIEVSKRLNRPHYIAAMLTEGCLLGGFSVISALTAPEWHLNNLPLMCMLSAAMGLQNAMITRLSGAVVRTTHMTGIVTDIGIESVRVAFLARDNAKDASLVSRSLAVLGAPFNSEARRLRLHIYILSSFILGAVVGPFVYLHIGYWGAIGPTLVLFGLALLDYVVGIEWHPEAHFVPQGRPANTQFLAMVAAELERNPEKAKAALDALRKRGLSQPQIPTPPVKAEEEVVISPAGSPAEVRTPPHAHPAAIDSARLAPVPEPAAASQDETADSLEASGVLKAPHGEASPQA